LPVEEQRGRARLGGYLKRLRTGYGFSLRRVEIKARSEGAEIDHSQLSRYERGRCYPSFDKLCALANIFSVSVQNFSDVLEMEKFDTFKPSPSLGFEELQTRGNAELESGNFGRAYVAFESALQSAEVTLGPDREDLRARARYKMAFSLFRLGKINLAESELRLILRDHQKISARTRFLTLLMLSNVHDERGDRYLALMEAERCLDLARSAGDRSDQAYALHAIGRTCFEEEDYTRAAEFHSLALEMARETASAQEIALLQANLGYCHVMLNRTDKGLKEIREALALSRKEGLRRGTAYCLRILGQVYYKDEKLARAREYFEEAETTAHSSESPYIDILFQSAFYLWEIARREGNAVQDKVYFGRMRHLRSSLERHFDEVSQFDSYIEKGGRGEEHAARS
jgi:tetratricopeptide (TPR) repeat protein